MNTPANQQKIHELIEMIGSMARLDFSKRLETQMSNDPLDLVSYGLNMLSEELEHSVIEKKRLEEINGNLERFSFTVAHDLKSPILASNGLLNLMQEEIEENSQIPSSTLSEYLSVLKDANTQVANMINGILQYSRLENEKMKMCKVSLSDLFWRVSQTYSSNEKVQIQYPYDLPIVKHNETALSQVLHNLISNAIKYNDKSVCEIRIEHSKNKHFHRVSVIDNGPGIKDSEKKVIFNLFENLRNVAYESTGVGLAIVEKIIQKGHGEIWVEDALPSGAKFNFTIPISDI